MHTTAAYEPIGAEIAKQVRDLRVIWMAVGKAFQDGHPACADCGYMASIEQRHPYGEGFATEYLCECTLGHGLHDSPMQCPAVNQSDEGYE